MYKNVEKKDDIELILWVFDVVVNYIFFPVLQLSINQGKVTVFMLIGVQRKLENCGIGR